MKVKNNVVAAVVLSLLASFAFAEVPARSMPLTNTRYGAVSSSKGVLTSNGHDTFLVWSAPRAIVMTRLVDGERRVGRAVFVTDAKAAGFDVVWTGTYFMIVASIADRVVGRFIDASGEPFGGEFPISTRGKRPRVAASRTGVLVAYDVGRSVEAILLDHSGAPRHPGAPPIRTKQGITYETAFDVASNGTGFAMLTGSSRSVELALLTQDGAVTAEVAPYVTQSERAAVSLASDGRDYLAVWASGGRVEATRFTSDGTPSAPLVISNGRLASAALHWTGSHYAAALVVSDTLHVTGIDLRPGAAPIPAHSVPAAQQSEASVISVGGRTRAAWSDPTSGAFVVADAAALADATIATYGAAEQELGASAASATGTLIAWTEILGNKRTLHSGVRRTNGEWVEQEIGTADAVVAAASNGLEFMLLVFHGERWSALSLDSSGKVIARSVPMPHRLEHAPSIVDVEWDGRDFVIAYVTDKYQLAVVRVSRSGVFSTPHVFAAGWIATNGAGFLLMWQEIEIDICLPCPDYRGVVYGLRLDADFNAIDATPIVFSRDYAIMAGPAFRNGTYYAYYADSEGLRWAAVPASGSFEVLTVENTSSFSTVPNLLSVTSTADAVAIWSRPTDHPTIFHHALRFPNRRHQGAMFEARDVVPVAGKLVHLGLHPLTAAPHHGASRLVLEGDPLVHAPDAPRATVQRTGAQFRIEWDAPSQAVSGYRVEYRIGQGSWNEISRWFDSHERRTIWSSVDSGQTYAFRVRAFNEGGVGQYSASVSVAAPMTGRRRSVRR